MEHTAENYMFNQMSVQKGINIFSKRAVTGTLKDYTQLYYMNFSAKVNPDKIYREEKKQTLRMIRLVKETRCGKIKGCACADVRPLSQYIKD